MVAPDGSAPKSRHRGVWRGVLVIVLAVASTAGIHFWARGAVAIPGCIAAAQAEGKEFVGYDPPRIGRSNRQAPDGDCLLKGVDGQVVERSLAKHLSGLANVTSLALNYELDFLASFVGWGLIVAAATRSRS